MSTPEDKRRALSDAQLRAAAEVFREENRRTYAELLADPSPLLDLRPPTPPVQWKRWKP